MEKTNSMPARQIQPRRHSNGMAGSLLIGAIGLITIVGGFLSGWLALALMLEPFALIKPVNPWVKISQPVVTAMLIIVMSNLCVKSTGLKPHALPASLLMLAPTAFIMAAGWTSILFIVHVAGPTADYGIDHGGMFIAVAVAEIMVIAAGWFSLFFCAVENRFFWASLWMRAVRAKFISQFA